MTPDVDVIGIDEAQFFDDQLPYVCDELGPFRERGLWLA